MTARNQAAVASGLGEYGCFVGRDGELRTMREAATKCETGEPWVVAVEGEPGVGKSSLTRRFARQLEGFTLLRACGDRAESDYGYGILEQLLARVEPALLAKCGSLQDVLQARGPA